MPTTTAIGDQLRDYIIEVLQASGEMVSRETRVSTKKVDVFLELSDSFSTRRIAIECKNVDHNLSQSELNSIYADFLAMLESKKIDELWVIVRIDFSPEAKAYAEDHRGLSIFTLAEFEERQHGFNKYVRQIKGLFEEDGLSAVYVPQHTTDGQPLIDVVESWVNDPTDNVPLAVLGGYGMGKSSFCRFLVERLASRYLANASERIPVYIRLSDIAKQQELEGLVAKTLADRYRIKDYHFEKFVRLNALGKFVLIFDGFDEMKHGLSWSEFKYNFSQINRTARDKAKIIIAGRPNAFLSDFEHNWALRGVIGSSESKTKLPEWPTYREIEMSQFSVEAAKEFLLKALHNFSDLAFKQEIERLDLEGSILLRPVHLKIFAEILKTRALPIQNYNTYELYDIATSQVSMREGQKVERALIDSEKRQAAIEEVAWWLWQENNGRSLHFNPKDVPFTIIRKPFKEKSDLDDEEKAREIFASSFLERKHGANFYFAHRSFLEFFVAKALLKSKERQYKLGLINELINHEIYVFIRESGKRNEFMDFILSLMQVYFGELDFFLLQEAFKRVEERQGYLDNCQEAVQVLFRYLNLYADLDSIDPESLKLKISNDCKDSKSDRGPNAVYYVLDVIRSMPESDGTRSIMETVLKLVLNAVEWDNINRKQLAEIEIPKLGFTRNNPLIWCLYRHARFTGEMLDGDDLLSIDLERFFFDLDEVRRPKIVLAGRNANTTVAGNVYKLRLSELASQLSPSAKQKIKEILSVPFDAR